MKRFARTIALAASLLLALLTALAAAADTPAAPAAKDAAAKDVPAQTTPAATAAATKKVQEKCPIMGGAIDKSRFVDKDGKRIYVCCPACIDKVKADFDKIAKNLEGQGIDLTIPKDAAKPEPKPETKPAETAK